MKLRGVLYTNLLESLCNEVKGGILYSFIGITVSSPCVLGLSGGYLQNLSTFRRTVKVKVYNFNDIDTVCIFHCRCHNSITRHTTLLPKMPDFVFSSLSVIPLILDRCVGVCFLVMYLFEFLFHASCSAGFVLFCFVFLGRGFLLHWLLRSGFFLTFPVLVFFVCLFS